MKGLSIREKARRRDGDGVHLRPAPGMFWRGRILTDGTELWLVVVHPDRRTR